MLLSTNVHLILTGQKMAHKRKATLTCATLYSLIEKHSQQQGYCFAKNSTLAAEMNKKKETVRYYLWLMKESGWINIKYHKDAAGSLIRDGIYPALSIDFEKGTITTKSGEVYSDQRSVEKAIRTDNNETPRDDEASVDDGDSFDAILEESTMPVDDTKRQEAKTVAPYMKKVEYHDETFLMMDSKAQQTYLSTLKDPEVKQHYINLLNGEELPEQKKESKEEDIALIESMDNTQSDSKLPRKLTNAEYNEWVKRNDKQGNMDRRGNIIDENFSDEIAAEIIAESDTEAAEESKTQDAPVKQIEANTQPNNTSTEVATVSNNAPAQQQTTAANLYGELATPMTSTRKNYDPAEKAFYDAAKSLGISITNHNQARKWVKEVVRTRGLESAVNYFDFMRLMFPKWQYEFKPTVKTVYDLVTKAAQIEQLIQRQRDEKKYKIDYQNLDLNKKL